ncbi:MFS transporter [Sphaerisporangium sp. NBC_01403]|uniref:MFS transporter n=1 Tax=Sphaerisporangium sp. NBC_01403 TaxID=2903599 RepID=UPI003864F067
MPHPASSSIRSRSARTSAVSRCAITEWGPSSSPSCTDNAVTLVPVGDALGVPPSQTAWLVSALYLATALGQPVVGRLIDIFGPRRLFLVSTSLVGVAGVVGTLAPNLGC